MGEPKPRQTDAAAPDPPEIGVPMFEPTADDGLSPEALTAMFALVSDALVVVEGESVVAANDSFARLTGDVRELLPGRMLTAFVDPQDRRLLSDLLDGNQGADTAEVELRLVTRVGVPRRVAQCRATPVRYCGQACTLVLVRDLTERQHLQARTAQAERMATVGMLASVSAQEVSLPLTRVGRGLQELSALRSSVPPGEGRARFEQFLGHVRDGWECIARFVSDLQTVYETDERTEPVRLREIIARTLKIAELKLARRITLDQELAALPALRCNQEHIAQIVLSLVVHASEVMPERLPLHQRRVLVRCWARDAEVCVSVEHSGPGPDGTPQQAPLVSQEVDACRGPVGLGLLISHSLSQQMGGWLQIESTPGHGTSFVVHLPIVGQAPQARLAAPAPRASHMAPRRGSLRVMVVDDEDAMAKALQRALSPLGRIETLSSGSEAMARLALDSHFDVVLCDMVMPDGTGLDVATWIRRYRPKLFPRLVFMTGLPGTTDRLSTEVPTVQKPFDIAALREVLLSIATMAAAADPHRLSHTS